MNLVDAQILAELHIEQHLDPSWTFAFNDRKRSFGLCCYRSKTIQLSAHLTKTETEDGVEQTILHEIAHALTPGTGHGAMWRAVARRLGVRNARGSRTRTGEVAPEEEKYTWAMVFGDEFVRGYYRRPNASTFRDIKETWLKGRKAETFGKLEIVAYRNYLRRIAK